MGPLRGTGHGLLRCKKFVPALRDPHGQKVEEKEAHLFANAIVDVRCARVLDQDLLQATEVFEGSCHIAVLRGG